MSESLGYLGQLAIATTVSGSPPIGVFGSVANILSFISHDLKETIPLSEDDGLRGTRSRPVETMAQGNADIKGSITFNPTPLEWDILIPYILGGTPSSHNFPEAEELPDLWVMVNNATVISGTVTTVASPIYGLRVTSAVISGEPGQKIKCVLNCVGRYFAPNIGTAFPSNMIAADKTARPYMFWDAGQTTGITINSVVYAINKFELTIDNKIVPTYMTGQYPTDLEPTDRMINLGIQTRFTGSGGQNEAALWAAARAGTGYAASIAFTNGSNALTFTFANLIATAESPVIPNRDPIRLPLSYRCPTLSTTKELVINSTP